MRDSRATCVELCVPRKSYTFPASSDLILILCWLAGANDEVDFWKFNLNLNFDDFDLWAVGVLSFYIVSFVT